MMIKKNAIKERVTFHHMEAFEKYLNEAEAACVKMAIVDLFKNYRDTLEYCDYIKREHHHLEENYTLLRNHHRQMILLIQEMFQDPKLTEYKIRPFRKRFKNL